jgi:RsiW-degrading membrane proteinase PrsW (M82 family)
VRRCGRNNIVAAILALLLGQYGAHKFYNGNRMLGIVYLVTTIIGYATLILLMTQKYNITDRQYLLLLLMGMLPMTVVAITSFVEAISYLTNKDKYNEKYNSIPQKSVRNYISSMFWGGVAGLLVACFLVRFVFDLNDNDVLRTDGGCIFLMIVVYWGIIGGLLFEDAPPKE